MAQTRDFVVIVMRQMGEKLFCTGIVAKWLHTTIIFFVVLRITGPFLSVLLCDAVWLVMDVGMVHAQTPVREVWSASPEAELPLVKGLRLREFLHVRVRLALVLEPAEMAVLGVLGDHRHLGECGAAFLCINIPSTHRGYVYSGHVQAEYSCKHHAPIVIRSINLHMSVMLEYT